MTGAYFDSSAILKRYLDEHGSLQARRLMRRYEVATSILARLEASSALVRRRARGELSKQAFDRALAGLNADAKLWELVQVEALLLELAAQIILQSGLKTIDALHVASALSLQQRRSQHVPFVTADQRQAAAARAHGLDVVAV